MTSKFKALTANTPPSSSASNTAAKVQPSKPSASSDNTPTFTETLNPQSVTMLSTEKNVLQISEKSRQHSVLTRVLLSNLESAGLIRRFKVLSKDGVWMETQIVFDNTYWDESLELKVLS